MSDLEAVKTDSLQGRYLILPSMMWGGRIYWVEQDKGGSIRVKDPEDLKARDYSLPEYIELLIEVREEGGVADSRIGPFYTLDITDIGFVLVKEGVDQTPLSESEWIANGFLRA